MASQLALPVAFFVTAFHVKLIPRQVIYYNLMVTLACGGSECDTC